MASSFSGAVVEYIGRELRARWRRDFLLEFQTGPLDDDGIKYLGEDLQRAFPAVTELGWGGDPDSGWHVWAGIRATLGRIEQRAAIGGWAAAPSPMIRQYQVRQRSLWRTA